jgi:nucleoside phosphorylase
MSSSRFARFCERATPVIGQALACRVAACLRELSVGARFTAQRLASELNVGQDEIGDALGIAVADDVRLLVKVAQVRCPHCDARIDLDPLIESLRRDHEALCPDCERPIDAPGHLRTEERLALALDAAREAAAWQATRAASPKRTAVIHCALIVELAAIRDQMEQHGQVEEHVAGNGFIHLGTVLEGQHVSWEVRAAQGEQTNAAAAASLTQAIGEWNPSVVMFVGVAGGVPGEVDLGDVVAATMVYDYEVGKDTAEGFVTRELQHRSAFRLRQRASLSATSDTWRRRVLAAAPALATQRDFNVKVEPIAAGSKVVASAESETFALISRAAPRAVAVEMEGAGFLEACQRFPHVDGIVIRGISDLLGGKADTDKQGWQKHAAANAAAFAFELLDQLELAG